MASSGSLFSQTLQDITTTKLEELAKKRKRFEDQRLALLAHVEAEQDVTQKLIKLADGVKSCFSVSTVDGGVVCGNTSNPRLEIDLQNFYRFLNQAHYDPSVSSKLLEQWQQCLLRHLDIQSLKFSFASLYGNLTTEWLQSKQATSDSALNEDVEMQDFEVVSNAKKLERRSLWENFVFTEANVDEAAVTQLLEDTFNLSSDESTPVTKAFHKLKFQVKKFESQLMSAGSFNFSTLNWTIKSLLTSDLLTDEKREVLKDFLTNPVILTEIADVLNMRMSAIDSWSWGNEVLLEERRQLNGSYRIYMHEDLLQAIFLQYLGIKWSVFWKKALSDLQSSKDVWKYPASSIPLLDRKRRAYYLGQLSDSGLSVQVYQQRLYCNSYFLSQLLSSERQDVVIEAGEEEADLDELPRKIARQTARSAQAPAQAQSFQRQSQRQRLVSVSRDGKEHDNVGGTTKNPMKLKQSLLHFLSTDILIKTRLHGEITCFRSQFSDLYPSLPHATIKSVLKFFGVSSRWITFFERFLQAPLRFLEDPEPARQRKRGAPGSHVLSEVFGEVVLFCLDHKVNQVTDGQILWRLHDDFWFWSSNREHCNKAWTTITSFAEVMGLTLNTARTGSARIGQRKVNGKWGTMAALEVEKPLPGGFIRWGMLYLNPHTGRFEIDQEMVNQHIDELRRQLREKSNSVFAWIQAWNTYAATFFASNFGQVANCFGQQHIDNMLATHERIQHDVFSGMHDDESSVSGAASASGGRPGVERNGVVGYLKGILEKRFGGAIAIKDIPDGYFFFPVELGGLELQSPFIGLIQIRDSVIANPDSLLDRFERAERESYEQAKTAYLQQLQQPQNPNEVAPIDGPTEYSFGQSTTVAARPPHLLRPQPFQPEEPDVFMPFEEYIKYRQELGYRFPHNLSQTYMSLLEQPSDHPEGSDSGSSSSWCRTNSDCSEEIKLALRELHNNNTTNTSGGSNGLKGILPEFHSMHPYWKWIALLYGPELIEKLGGFNIVDPGSLPMGMVNMFRSGRVKWQD